MVGQFAFAVMAVGVHDLQIRRDISGVAVELGMPGVTWKVWKNDLVVSDAVTEDIFPNRTGTVLAEHQRSRLEAAAATDIEATTSGSTSLPTLALTGSDAAAPANSSRVLSADTSCWNLSQEISRLEEAPKTP